MKAFGLFITLILPLFLSAQVNNSDENLNDPEKERIHLERIEVGKNLKRNKIISFKSKMEPQLQNAKNHLADVEKFQLGRSEETRRRQISEANEVIRELESIFRKIDDDIARTALFRSFEFQNTPTGVVEHIFYAADSSDFSKLKHLVDPYGDFDDGVLPFILLESLPKPYVVGFVSNFKNGRIMSEPVITGEVALVEVAIGPSSNQLKVMNLIKRKDRWYLQSF